MRSKVKQTRERIEALRLALLSPAAEEIAAALAGLDEAVRCLQAVEREMRAGIQPADDLRLELKLLKNDLRISSRLIRNGMAFCEGWARMLGSGPTYDSSGQAEPAERPGNLLVLG